MMGLTEPSTRRTVPVTLRDIDPAVRGAAAIRLCEKADADERLDLLAAAVDPSDTTYWVAA